MASKSTCRETPARHTHTFLWFVLKDTRLSTKAESLVADPNHQIKLSMASCWEIAIKIGIGKYSLSEPFEAFMNREIAINRFDMLPILI